MKKQLIFLALLALSLASTYAQETLNLELFAQYNRGDGRASGSWSYATADGAEYALLGAQTGTSIISISNANQIEEVAFIPGPPSNWREVTVVNDHAYVVTEGSSSNHPGMQVIDLSNLPASAELTTSFNSTFSKGHIIQKDIFDDSPYAYVCGTTTTSGVHIIDVAEPSNPQEVGLYQPGYYIHDCHIRGDIMYAAAFYEATIDIVDISDKSNPTLLQRLPDPGANTHSFSTTEDGNFLIICDELDGLPGRIWDISDIDNPKEVALYTANSASLVHNPYMRGDFCFISHNTEGLRVLDMADPNVPVEVGYYDTFSGPSGGFNGLWSACPYLPSGKIIGGNRADGLYVWEFNNARAGRFYAQVVDAETGIPILNADIIIPEEDEVFSSDFEGRFQGGFLPGNYTLDVSASGYMSASLSIDLVEGSEEELIIALTPLVSQINEADQLLAISISPNPSSQQTTIDLSTLPNNSQLKFFDTTGRVITSYEPIIHERLTINTSTWKAGVYFLVAYDSIGQVIGKEQLIIQQ
jgi:choice-of-anchor B domain-containing protein